MATGVFPSREWCNVPIPERFPPFPAPDIRLRESSLPFLIPIRPQGPNGDRYPIRKNNKE